MNWESINAITNSALVILGGISLWYVRKEYFLKRRPFVTAELVNEINGKDWHFFIVLVNKGTFPGVAKVSKCILQIGDEKYPTSFDLELVLAPNEKQKILYVGHINENGRKKILGHEYSLNRVTIKITVTSKFVTEEKFQYKTLSEYLVDVSKEKPSFSLISEKLT